MKTIALAAILIVQCGAIATSAYGNSACAKMENDQLRLVCYDNIYKPIEARVASDWKYTEFVDKIDDRIYASSSIESEEKNSILILRCGGIEPELSFRFYQPITFNEFVYVKYRIDDLPPSELETWRLDSDSKATSPIDSKPIFGKMRDNARFILTALAQRGPGNILATFQLGAFNEAKHKIALMCAKLKRK